MLLALDILHNNKINSVVWFVTHWMGNPIQTISSAAVSYLPQKPKTGWNELQDCSVFWGFFVFLGGGFCFFFFRVTPTAYESSQAKGPIRATAASLYHSHSNTIWAAPASYTTPHSNTASLTHWARPGIEPTPSWFLVRFVSTASWRELWDCSFDSCWKVQC